MEKSAILTLDQVSAGGVAFRRVNSEIEIAIVSVNPSRRWQLPKGIVDEGEQIEKAALREVREEAGIECELLEKIETIEYWYIADQKGKRVRFHKFVHFFLMKYMSGKIENHDHEIAESCWVSPGRAIEMLDFKSEKDVVKKASEIIAKFW